MPTISAIIIAKNEANRIAVCLDSIKWVDEIIVVDKGSTDKTVEIAKKYTDKIIQVEKEEFDFVRNEGTKNASGDWILYVDPDERVLEPLKKEIESMVTLSDFSAFAISRKNVIFGKEVKYGSFWPDWVIRLLKKSDFEGWIGKVHEYPKFRGNLGYSKNSLLHLTHRDVDQIVLKSLEWSKIDAALRIEANHPKMSSWRFFRIFISEIFNQGIIRKGFFNGTVGVMDSLLQSFSMFITYIRLWQLQQTEPIDKKYDEIDKNLIKNGFNY